MSSETDDKTQSTFPRSSLRARNRAIVMAPADAEDFRPEPRKTKTPIRLEDIFDEPFAEVPSPTDSKAAQSTRTSTGIGGISTSALEQALGDGIPDAVEESKRSPTRTHPETQQVQHSDLIDSFEMGDDGGLASFDAQNERAPQVGREQLGATQGSSDSVSATPAAVAPVAKIVRTVERVERVAPPQEYSKQEEDAVTFQDATSITAEDEYVSASRRHVTPKSELNEIDSSGTSRERVESQRISKLVGFLITYQVDPLGEYIELREGRLLVSRTGGASDNCLVIADPSVSPMHAIMRISSDGTILILDQLSEHGTRIKRRASGKEETLLGDKSTLEHEDVVIFGECAYHVCILKMGVETP
jgi:hypothetical protein